MGQAIDQTPAKRYTVEEYFEIDNASDQRHEYRNGEIVAMAGGTEAHSLIKANVIRALGNRLEAAPCRVYESDLRVRVDRKSLYAYPDVFVVCGERQFDPDDNKRLTVMNPTLVVEVLSPSTEGFDRGEKFRYYMQCQSFREYVLVVQNTARVETFFRREDTTWVFAYFDGNDAVVRLHSLGVDLPLKEVYAKVDLPVPNDT